MRCRPKSPSAGVTQAWNSLPADISIEFTDEQRIQFMYGPPETYDRSVLNAAGPASSPIPVAELLEVVGGWIRDFRPLPFRSMWPFTMDFGARTTLDLQSGRGRRIRGFAHRRTDQSPRIRYLESVTTYRLGPDSARTNGPELSACC